MNKLLLAALMLILSQNSFAQTTKGCGEWLKAYTKYEVEEKGQIVWKHELFSIGNWDPNEQFNGIVLIKSVEPSPTLLVEYAAAHGGKTDSETFNKLLPFEMDPRVKEFDDFGPKDFFKFREPGTFKITLKSGTRVLCSQSGRYRVGH